MFYYLCRLVWCVALRSSPSARAVHVSSARTGTDRTRAEGHPSSSRASLCRWSPAFGRATPRKLADPPSLPAQHPHLAPLPALRLVQGPAPARERRRHPAGTACAARALVHVLVRARGRRRVGRVGGVERQLVSNPLSRFECLRSQDCCWRAGGVGGRSGHGMGRRDAYLRSCLSRFPFYHEVKTLAILWLSLPQIEVRMVLARSENGSL